ncbi:hypothetical protein K466DRAFT_660137 [Polyporus arcularius HHB13444]|uniref:F-box domain-containing protein n=1 Tax=Polyporus arcularius HHB13444 TaxID=1314778 RepID=A0A5C3PSL1_9APHY|nr:hypothetical protein K466DRAFT_660137 [Polyporus arcularius HHB13444]
MPWDVLLEIFSVMHPRELLILARTSKEYREFLMSRNAARFWKAARQQSESDLPDCPPFLSEPAYANLVFFAHCHNCTAPNVKTVIWEFLARYCQKCKEDMRRRLSDHTEIYFMVDIVEQDTRVKIADFLNGIHISPSRGSFPRPFYHSEEFREFQRDVYGLRAGVHLSAFVKQKAENVKLRKQFATTMREWETKQDQRRVSENEALKDARLEAVKQRLRDEGYGPQLDTMVLDELKLLGPVRQARQLSDRGWKTIRDKVVGFMESVRVDVPGQVGE